MTTRKYSQRPLVGVGAVIIENDEVLLVKRAKEPKANFWTLPGGLVEIGETIHDALKREIREECQVEIELKEIIDVVDYIEKNDAGDFKYHYVLVDFEAKIVGGTLSPGSDVLETRWVSFSELKTLNLPKITSDFFQNNFPGLEYT